MPDPGRRWRSPGCSSTRCCSDVPKSTRNWASRAVLGERIWVDRDKIELPEQFRSRPRSLVANAYSVIGMGFLAFGLIDLNLLVTVAGILITHGARPGTWTESGCCSPR